MNTIGSALTGKEKMTDKGIVIGHLQMLYTWALWALDAYKKGVGFFNEERYQSLAEWVKDALDTIKEDTETIDDLISIDSEYDELRKKYNEQKGKYLRCIADNQLANAPHDLHIYMNYEEHLKHRYQSGVYDGLQMAYEIISEGKEPEPKPVEVIVNDYTGQKEMHCPRCGEYLIRGRSPWKTIGFCAYCGQGVKF